jgi:hypothetical protein
MYDALDALQLSSTQWNYTASNRNDLRIGDGWNQEDLSIFSPDQAGDPGRNDPDAGARGPAGLLPALRAADPGRDRRDALCRRTLRAGLEADPAIAAPTEIYVPEIRFPNGVRVSVSQAGARWTHDRAAQKVRVWAVEAGPLEIVVEGPEAPSPRLGNEKRPEGITPPVP